MLALRVGNLRIQLDREGNTTFNKAAKNDFLGRFVRMLSDSGNFNFDLEGRIHRIDGFPSPHSWDWLQRTMTNDWIYYDKVWTHGGIPHPTSIIGDAAWPVNGRTDLPMLAGHKGLQSDYVAKAFDAFDVLINTIRDWLRERPPVYSEFETEAAAPADEHRLWDFLTKVAKNDRERLQQVADRLHAIHGHMRVLPPDTIHVDYRVILVKVMDGCVNNCGFCTVRGDSPFSLKSKSDIDRQIDALPAIYGSDLHNYNSVVFGECDALVSPFLEYAARRAFDTFRCGLSYHTGSNLFLFSTNKSLCGAPDSIFDMLDSLPFEKVCLNIGWEAATDAALNRLGKRQTADEVLAGMEKAGEINRKRRKVKVSGNFITADGMRCDDIISAIRKTRYCGRLYLSPLRGACSSTTALNDLHHIRDAKLDVTVYLYTMQRI